MACPHMVLFPSAGGSSDQIPLPSPYTTRRIGPRNAPAGTHVRREAVEGPYGLQRDSRLKRA
jgi:hypothetical protein